MDIFIGLVMLLVGLLFGHLITRPRKYRQPAHTPTIERSQVYHDMQARRLLAECDL